ncbi:MAG: DUF445 family protein [Rubrivivax sp.]|nr:DUF445 family protein [Rubrivivax sp.]
MKENKSSTIKRLRDFALWALPAVTVVTAVLDRLFPEATAADWAFKIALSGTVGIWTNFFAIKMLFRPRRRMLLGLQGLIPANRKKLAEAIGKAVAEDLLAPDLVFGFIEKNDIIGKMGSEAIRLAHLELDKPASRAWLKTKAGSMLKKVTAENVEGFLKVAVEKVRQIAGDRLAFARIWPSLRSELEKQLSSGPIHDALGRVAVKLAKKYAPDAAKWVNDRVDSYIESRGWLARNALRAAKWAFSFDEEEIEGFIVRQVKSPSFGPSVLRALESLAPEASKLMENPRVRQAASDYFEKQKQGVMSWLETEGRAQGKAMILEMMDSEPFWDAMERQIDRAVRGITAWAAGQLETGRFREFATPLLRKLAAQVPVAAIVEDRVDHLELDDLEALIYDVTSENLAGIELIGGVLGCVAGVVLIEQWLLLPIVACCGTVAFLTRRRAGDDEKADEAASGDSVEEERE